MRSSWLLAVTFGSLLGACTTAIEADEAPSIDTYIQGLPYLPVEPAAITMQDPSAPAAEGDYQCTTQNLQETRQYDKIVAYAANSDSLYPGSIVSADSVISGLFTQIVLPRAPETISISLENLAGGKKAIIKNPSLSGYRDAVAGILDTEITGSTPANLYSEIEEVHSQEQLNMSLGVEASWGLSTASLKTSFDWSKQNTRSRYLVKYTQTYYTVDMDAPSSPSSLFLQNVSLDDVKNKMDETRPPTYVSSVTYGRMVIFTFESEYSNEEMSSALNFAYNGGIDVKGDVSVTYKDMINSSKITAFILGGDASQATMTINSYDALIDFIKQGGNYSKESPGAPIAYKLSYLKDNSPARMSYTTNYDVKDCARVSQKVRVTLDSIQVDDAGGDAGDDLELYGRIFAEGTNQGTLFEKNNDNYVVIHQGNMFGGGTPIAETIIQVSPQAGQSIKLHADLKDADGFLNSDDEIGNDTQANPFESGWRKSGTIQLTGDSSRVQVHYTMTPI
ncbi:MAG TPA: thiol-activated cytolysin family protein [Kofleriaceae bacterium]|jgi:thiol-activated cytolysin